MFSTLSRSFGRSSRSSSSFSHFSSTASSSSSSLLASRWLFVIGGGIFTGTLFWITSNEQAKERQNNNNNVALCAPKKQFKVAVIGAGGGIGQPLSLLMKQSKLVSELRLYDVVPTTAGIACDLSHINTPAKVTGHTGPDMKPALEGADLVIIPAGVPRKPGMTRDDLFNVNAGIVAGIAEQCAVACPNAFLLVISNPVNSTVPIVAEILKKKGVYKKEKLFGVTSLDVCRANTFVAENQKMDVSSVNVPVIGGHAGVTILPLLSQVKGAKFTQLDVEALTKRIMFGGDEVVAAKAGNGSATLSMAYAGADFAEKVLRAASGESGISECAYVDSPLSIGANGFFASKVDLGVNGITRVPSLPNLNDFEEKKLKEALPELNAAINKGREFVANRK